MGSAAMDEILVGKRVLVVDDTSVARLLTDDILTAVGIDVFEAENGAQALELAREQPIDAFLLDIKLPDMNGIELCRTLRSMEPYRSSPIIFVTAMDQREVLQWAIEAGADDFIQKPLHAMVLRRRLANLLQKSHSIRQAELMSQSLRRYVSPRTEQMARAYATTGKAPAPTRQEVCVLFTDARGFTEMSQDLEPEAVFEILSGHLAAQVDLVYRHGGYIDKYSGDGIMAVFDGEHMARECCLCALEILEYTKAHSDSQGPQAIRLGIGINKGQVTIGNLGSGEHLDYTVVGKAVNLAARLCGLASQSIVVSQSVHEAAGGTAAVAFHAERAVVVRGFREPVTVYDLQRTP
jgi:class 3 adenylate cyclase